jgi:hypothetical protein
MFSKIPPNIAAQRSISTFEIPIKSTNSVKSIRKEKAGLSRKTMLIAIDDNTVTVIVFTGC